MPATTVDRGRGADRHLQAAAEYIAIAESGDAERSAYEHAAIEIEAAMQDDPSLSQREIARRIGKDQKYVVRLLEALRRTRSSGDPFRVDWQRGKRGRMSDLTVGARDRPADYVRAFEQAPPEARQQIARQISRAPEVRMEARKRDAEAEEQRRPSPVEPRGDVLYFRFESRLSSAESMLRQALAVLSEIDQPGDNEDTIDKIGRLRTLVEVIEEAYRTGKSLDTWAAELFEEAG